MDRIMNARTFRREFATIAVPVTVISKEHVVGRWMPNVQLGIQVMGMPVTDKVGMEILRETPNSVIAGNEPMTQAQRDAILRKINKS